VASFDLFAQTRGPILGNLHRRGSTKLQKSVDLNFVLKCSRFKFIHKLQQLLENRHLEYN